MPEYDDLFFSPEDIPEEQSAFTLDDYRIQADSIFSQPDFFEQDYKDQVAALRGIYLGPEGDGSVNWEDEDGVVKLHKELASDIRQANGKLVTPEDYAESLPEKPDLTLAKNTEEAHALLDDWEEQAKASARLNLGIEWDEIEEPASKQIESEVDSLKRYITAKNFYEPGALEGQDTELTLREGSLEPGVGPAKQQMKEDLAAFATAVKAGASQFAQLVPDALGGDELRRSVETSALLPDLPYTVTDPQTGKPPEEDPEYETPFGPFKQSELLAGVGSMTASLVPAAGFAKVGAVAGLGEKAATALTLTPLMSMGTRLAYKEAYDDVYAKTQNPQMAAEAGWKAVPGGALDGAGDAVVGMGLVPGFFNRLGNKFKTKFLAKLSSEGLIGKGLRTGFSAAVEGGTEGAQEVLSGLAKESATGDPEFRATGREIALATTIGALGGTVAGVSANEVFLQRMQAIRGTPVQEATSDSQTAQEEPAATQEKATATQEEPIQETAPEELVGQVDEIAPEPSKTEQPKPEAKQEVTEPVDENVQTQEKVVQPSKIEGLQTEEVPLENLEFNAPELPQFKSEGDERGIVEPLQGKFERLGTGPIVIFETNDGRQIITSGRHRADLAQRSGEKTIPAQIIKESEGYTFQDAQVLDAELNIRDEQGSVQDFSNYFRIRELQEDEAKKRGLLSRAKGKQGFAIGTKAESGLFELHQAGKISDQAAAVIAETAPNNEPLQRLGMKEALKGTKPELIQNILEISKQTEAAPQEQQTDMFGAQTFDNVRKLAEAAVELRNDARETLRTLNQAKKLSSKGKEVLSSLPGISAQIDIQNPQALDQAKAALQQRISFLAPESWPLNPEAVQEVKNAANEKLKRGEQIELPVTPPAQTLASVVEPRTRVSKKNFIPELTPEKTSKKPEIPKRQPELPSREEQPIERMSIPASVRLARQITEFVPKLFKSDALLRGAYHRKTGRVLVNEKLPRDPEQLARTLAHEIGHAIDLLSRQPNQTGLGSNLLGRLVPLARFGKKVFGQTEVLEKLLPSQKIEHDGRNYTISVAYGVIRPFMEKEVIQNGEKVKKTVPVSKSMVPEIVLDKYANQLKGEKRELFNRVRDWTVKDGVRPVTETYSVDSGIGAVMADPILRREAWELSRRWRPLNEEAATPKFMEYRLTPQELYADFLSAIINSPEWVKSNYPNLFRAFKNSLYGKPDALEAMEELSQFLDNPEALIEILQIESAASAKRSIDIAKQAIADKTADRKKLLERIKSSIHPKRMWDTARQLYMENFIPIQDAVSREVELLHQRKARVLKKLESLQHLSPRLKESRKAKIDRIVRDMKSEIQENEEIVEGIKTIPQKQWLYVKDVGSEVETPLLSLGVKPTDWHNYLVANRIINETTPAREWIRNNPEEAKLALEWIVDNAPKAGYSNFDAEQFQAIANSELTGDALADNMAKLDLELETTDPAGKKRAKLAKLADNINDANLFDIVTDGFNVRRYMANPNGWTPKEAQAIIDELKSKYGEPAFEQVEDLRRQYGDLNWNVLKLARRAGLFSSKFFKRLELNKDNYANFSVLRYFAENPKFSANFHKQVGTFEDLSDSFLSTTGKTTMLLGRAVRQLATNTAIQAARDTFHDLGVDGVREVRNNMGKRIHLPRFVWEAYEHKRNLQANPRNPEFTKSYLVEMSNGKPVLWEIDDPSWQRMMEQEKTTDLGPVLSTALNLQQLQKAFYTVLSPAFVFGTDPIRNKARETALASEKMPKLSFMWWHLAPSLQRKSRVGKQIAENLFEWANGDIDTLPPDMPFREEVLDLVQAGRLMLPISGRFDLARTVVGPIDASPGDIAQVESIAEMAQMLGHPERFQNSLIADSVDLATDIFGSIPGVGTLAHSFAEILGRHAQVEELRTKLTGYLIEQERTETLRDAGKRAELWYGAPRPRGGGTRNAEAEAVFLFWRVNAYAPRVMKQILKDEPITASNIFARKLFQLGWRIPVVGGVLAGALADFMDLDDKEKERFQLNMDWAYRMIGRYEKSAQNPIPFGFYNPDINEFANLWEANPEDLANGWKAVYLRRPSDPDERIVSRLLYSMLEGGVQAQNKKGLTEQLSSDVASELPDFNTAAVSATQLFRVLQGENPSDDFYQRGILPRDIAEGGTQMEKILKFGEYLLGKHLPYFNYNLSSREKKAGEKIIREIPGASKLLGISNYGLIEAENTSKTLKEFERNARRLNYPQVVKDRYREYFRLQKIGPDKRTKQQQQDYIALGNWKFSVFDYYDNEIRHAQELKDKEFSDKLHSQLLEDTNKQASFWKAKRGRRQKQKKKESPQRRRSSSSNIKIPKELKPSATFGDSSLRTVPFNP